MNESTDELQQMILQLHRLESDFKDEYDKKLCTRSNFSRLAPPWLTDRFLAPPPSPPTHTDEHKLFFIYIWYASN